MSDTSSTHKPWYKQWWGIVLAVLVWPLFLGWFLWSKTSWSRAIKIGASIGLLFSCFMMSAAYAGVVTGIVSPLPPSHSTAKTESANKTKQTADKVTFAQVTGTEPIPFKVTTQDDNTLPVGQTKVIKAGQDGVSTVVYMVSYTNGKEVFRQVMSQTTTTPPVDEVDAVGTYVPPLLDASGNGAQTTQKFTTSSDWNINYTYDCSSFGFKGNFAIYIYDDNGNVVDLGANEVGMSGGNTDYQHSAGTYYLEINSECNWHVTVTQ